MGVVFTLKFLKSIFTTKDSELSDRYNEAIRLYGEELKQHKKEVLAEMEKIDKMYETELLRYIAKTLFTIKDKLNNQ